MNFFRKPQKLVLTQTFAYASSLNVDTDELFSQTTKTGVDPKIVQPNLTMKKGKMQIRLAKRGKRAQKQRVYRISAVNLAILIIGLK